MTPSLLLALREEELRGSSNSRDIILVNGFRFSFKQSYWIDIKMSTID